MTGHGDSPMRAISASSTDTCLPTFCDGVYSGRWMAARHCSSRGQCPNKVLQAGRTDRFGTVMMFTLN
ncbi:hypothetical protein JMJ77_0002157 [Colletotrichum scovillei]|uniref:Uncharacterized protein n=1 Tax=Colletotrichum scovillei TaxID=1209932 RepID=A0A9P7R7C6_9PEZI|nr:hypothetical protein JMJ77_0002157 [Colletotrichum scovillei]KAG7070573.1 hypothetical protein JMJ76_0001822 [Colletotrichum scovillei]KAG7078823.1 hypothetical protein JMJ78_0002488 [Colletotrichum scovillei]